MKLTINFAVATSAFAITFFIDPYYTGGDASAYRTVYDNIGNLEFFTAFAYYSSTLNSTEVIHFLLTWLCSSLNIDRVFFTASLSAALSFLLVELSRREKASLAIASLVLLTSFYFILLYTTTERLKVAMIFFTLSILNKNRSSLFYLFTFISSISHVQILILYSAMLFSRIPKVVEGIIRRGKIPKASIIVAAISLGTLILMREQLYSKFEVYFNEGNIFEAAYLLPFLFFVLWHTRDKLKITLIFTPLMLSAAFLGYGRINIFAYFVFLYYVLPVNRGFNFFILITTLYFSYSSAIFISRIIEFGNPSIL